MTFLPFLCAQVVIVGVAASPLSRQGPASQWVLSYLGDAINAVTGKSGLRGTAAAIQDVTLANEL